MAKLAALPVSSILTYQTQRMGQDLHPEHETKRFFFWESVVSGWTMVLQLTAGPSYRGSFIDKRVEVFEGKVRAFRQ